MKLKSLLLTITATLGMYAVTKAQVPNYVPTDGLVGWYPFNGNANDESLLGTNGVIQNTNITSDRFDRIDQSYYFNGVNSNIDLGINTSINSISNSFSITYWIKPESFGGTIIANYSSQGLPMSSVWRFVSKITSNGKVYFAYINSSNPMWQELSSNELIIDLNKWHHCVYTRSGATSNLYINGVLVSSKNNLEIGNLDNPTSPAATTKIGYNFPSEPNFDYYKGLIDDIGIWNRALTEKEVINLYNASICSNDLFITAQNNTLQTGGNVTFTATTSDANASYIWQSDLGQGYQTLNNYGNYSGTNSENLNISNLQLSNHNQAIRAISTTEECTDTSNVATIKLTDTCISLISVTDTLIINAQITNTNLPVKINTLKVFPNPASSQITIDYGNFNEMSGYTLTIVNSLGQSVFSTPINQQTSIINLSSISGKGFYFIRVIDPQNNTIENRKLIIE